MGADGHRAKGGIADKCSPGHVACVYVVIKRFPGWGYRKLFHLPDMFRFYPTKRLFAEKTAGMRNYSFRICMISVPGSSLPRPGLCHAQPCDFPMVAKQSLHHHMALYRTAMGEIFALCTRVQTVSARYQRATKGPKSTERASEGGTGMIPACLYPSGTFIIVFYMQYMQEPMYDRGKENSSDAQKGDAAIKRIE